MAVAWLCFMIAALPCAATTADSCCPDTGTEDAHAGHGMNPGGMMDHAGHAMASPVDETCLDQLGDPCCDEPVPTLEDRTPKTPLKAVDLASPLITTTSGSLLLADRVRFSPATGPPDPIPLDQRRHAVLETWLD